MSRGFAKKAKGFTLLEIMIAMAISALIGIAAMALLDRATVAHANIKHQGSRFNQIERTWLFISNDIQQLAPRQFRDEFGDKKNNLTSDDATGTTHLSFTRLGRRNPAKLPRSNLEKLSYLVEDNVLKRVSFVYPDGMSNEQGQKRPLLEDVIGLSVNFFDGEEWHPFWPVDQVAESTENQLPVALKLGLELKDLGMVERLFVLSDEGVLSDKEERN
jgi:general secretion pathway protein J